MRIVWIGLLAALVSGCTMGQAGKTLTGVSRATQTVGFGVNRANQER